MQNFSRVIILVNFKINQEYIAKNLCVNKEEPDSCCEGSCQLKKQLEEEDKKEQAPPVRSLKETQDLQMFCYHKSAIQITKVTSLVSHSTPYKFSKFTSPNFSIFHPPNC